MQRQPQQGDLPQPCSWGFPSCPSSARQVSFSTACQVQFEEWAFWFTAGTNKGHLRQWIVIRDRYLMIINSSVHIRGDVVLLMSQARREEWKCKDLRQCFSCFSESKHLCPGCKFEIFDDLSTLLFILHFCENCMFQTGLQHCQDYSPVSTSLNL